MITSHNPEEQNLYIHY